MSIPLTSVAPDSPATPARVSSAVAGSAVEGSAAGTAAERVTELRERMNGMQRDRWEPQGRVLPGGLAALLPQGRLRSGVAYSVDNSTSLIMAILGAATTDGGWGAVVGLPDFGVEAAVGFGIDLERLVLVPSPGDQWLAVTAALVDVLPLVVVHPERTVGAAEVARLGARLRQTGCTLIVAGGWAQSEAALRVTGTRWEGLGAGHGYLSGRDLSVAVDDRAGPRRTGALHLPDPGTDLNPAETLRRPPLAAVRSRAHLHPAAG
ncbi:hypothetical protein BJQ94_09325 [Cryobacterium sp. SO2]|uniref:hypothetical protein n=1 Tax=Cryobacterium sp. SO2 TaxID=1897060 RepID=UPI00223CF0AA|nr:hypothetical protein [Cryobacterium sp. SO2]WEO79209.1 hypothetical protein BJQ94_09325 [Cryobacterium sp. SO2]